MIRYYKIIKDENFMPREPNEYYSVSWAKIPSKVLEENPDIIRTARSVSKSGIIKNQSVVYLGELSEEDTNKLEKDCFHVSDFSEDVVFIIY